MARLLLNKADGLTGRRHDSSARKWICATFCLVEEQSRPCVPAARRSYNSNFKVIRTLDRGAAPEETQDVPCQRAGPAHRGLVRRSENRTRSPRLARERAG